MVLLAQKYMNNSFGYISDKHHIDRVSASQATIMYLAENPFQDIDIIEDTIIEISYSTIPAIITEEEKLSKSCAILSQESFGEIYNDKVNDHWDDFLKTV